MKKLLAAFVLVFAASALAAATPKVTGDWNIHSNIAGNESDQPCKFSLGEDNKLTGTCKSQEGKDLAVTGALDGNKLTWKYESDYNGTPLTLIYTATLDESGKIAGNVEVQPFGVTGDFTATPKEDAK